MPLFAVSPLPAAIAVNAIETYIRNKESEDDEYHLISSMETALLGSPAHKFVVSAKDSENDPYQAATYVFTLGGQTYFADLLLYDATHTAKAEQLLNDVLRSLKAD